uniref:Uncharacterized protein n=1 Tax=Ficus carica TaxID=3494 RepID=A0AA87ZGK2_FICCA|nr:hypothetical protein TIFTF001_049129 [Ficus carica]
MDQTTGRFFFYIRYKKCKLSICELYRCRTMPIAAMVAVYQKHGKVGKEIYAVGFCFK